MQQWECTEQDEELNHMVQGFQEQRMADSDAVSLYWGAWVWRAFCQLACATVFGYAAEQIIPAGLPIFAIGAFIGTLVGQGCATKTFIAAELWNTITNVIVDAELGVAQEDGEDFYFLTVNCDVYRLLRYNKITKQETGSIVFVTIYAQEEGEQTPKTISTNHIIGKVGFHDMLQQDPYKTGWVHPVRGLDIGKQYILKALVTLSN